MKKILSKNFILLATLGVVSAGGITLGSLIATGVIKIGGGKSSAPSIQYRYSNWDDFGTSMKEFSKKNSYKVGLATDRNGNNISLSLGTAWSFYLDTSSSNVSWYLFTNFHVVDQAVNYNGGAIGVSNGLVYNHSTTINHAFYLQDTIEHQSNFAYRTLFTNSEGRNLNGIGRGYISSDVDVKVITDISNKYNNGDNLNLFSNSTNDINNYYNLDISIIKLSFSKTLYNQHHNDFFSAVANPYQKYLDLGYKANDAITTNNVLTYIAGNPGSADKLTPAIIQPKDGIHDQKSYSFLNSFNGSPNTHNLYFASWVSNISYKDWPLTEGASGSAVYQLPNVSLPNDNIDMFQYLPVGIYWGGYELSNRSFIPSFIPFLTDRYNIYENFGDFLNSNYNR